MGIFGSGKSITDVFSNNKLLDKVGNLSLTDGVTDALGIATEDVLRGALGMNPVEPCPAGGSGASAGAGAANDPCGADDNPLKNAALGLGMALAGPTIAAAGAEIGDIANGALGTVTSALGSGIGFAADSVGGAMGLDPDSPAQNVISSSLGVGTLAAISGNTGDDLGAAFLGGAAQSVNNINKSPKSTGLFDSLKTTAGL